MRAEAVARVAYGVTCLVAVGFLGFVGGSVATLSDAAPAKVVRDAYHAGTALYRQVTEYRDPLLFDLWRPARSDSKGVTRNDPHRTGDGFTLFTSGHQQQIQLIDADGRLVHAWGRPYSELWDETAAVKKPLPDNHIYIERGKLYPNGDLLALYVAVGATPWGYGLVKYDADSNVQWKYLQHVHHDLDVGADGRIYVLTQEIGTDVVPGREHLKPPRIDDYVAVLSPEGEELKKIRLVDALARSPFARGLDMVPWYVEKGSGDYLHTNAVEVLDGTRAQKLPQATAGRLLLSFRELNTIAILDVETEEIVWAMRGSWIRQHDPDLLENGNILLFDNQGHVGDGGMSRVMEIDPATEEVVWSYVGTAEEPFSSEVRSAQDRLSNGNTLITESDAGRLFEVTPAGDIVWDWTNPIRERRESDGQEVIPIVQWAERIDATMLEPQLMARLESQRVRLSRVGSARPSPG